MRATILLAFVLVVTSCTEGYRSKAAAFYSGAAARVTCYSGGKPIYDSCSTGKVSSEKESDGYFFRDAVTNRLVEVSGECVIDYEAPCPQSAVRPGP